MCVCVYVCVCVCVCVYVIDSLCCTVEINTINTAILLNYTSIKFLKKTKVEINHSHYPGMKTLTTQLKTEQKTHSRVEICCLMKYFFMIYCKYISIGCFTSVNSNTNQLHKNEPSLKIPGYQFLHVSKEESGSRLLRSSKAG